MPECLFYITVAMVTGAIFLDQKSLKMLRKITYFALLYLLE